MSAALLSLIACVVGAPVDEPRCRMDWRWDYDGRAILGAVDREARLWDEKTGRLVQTFKGNVDWIRTVSFVPGDRKILTTAGTEGDYHRYPMDTSIRLWDIASGKEVQRFEGLKLPAHSVDARPDLNRLIAVADDGVAMVWDLTSGKPLVSLSGVHAPIFPPIVPDAFFSPDGRTILALATFKVRVMNAATAQEELVISDPGGKTQFSSAAFSPDGKWIVTTQTDPGKEANQWKSSATIWDAKTGKPVRRLDGVPDWMSQVLFADRGREILAGGSGSMATWNTRNGIRIDSHTVSGGSFVVSPDGNHFLIRQGASGVSEWDISDKRMTAVVPDATNVTAGPVGFSADGRTFLVRDLTPYGEIQSVSILSSDSGKLVHRIQLEGLTQ